MVDGFDGDRYSIGMWSWAFYGYSAQSHAEFQCQTSPRERAERMDYPFRHSSSSYCTM
jgi:hypothetical protein